jgi:hypothetical protein
MSNYQHVAWSRGETMTAEKLNQMAVNDRFLYLNRVQWRYNVNSIRFETGLKIACGVAVMPIDINSQTVSRLVEFPPLFATGSRPVVTTGMATLDRVRSMVAISGYTSGDISPDSKGFRVTFSHQLGTTTLTIARPQFVHWIAMGY